MESLSQLLQFQSPTFYTLVATPTPPPPPAWKEVAEAIRGMSAAIEKRGWTQRTLSSGYGVCMLGAFLCRNGHTFDRLEYASPLGTVVGELLCQSIRKNYSSLPPVMYGSATPTWNYVIGFNDSFSRTKEEVLAILTEAREYALEKAAPEPTVQQLLNVPDFVPDSMAMVAAGV